MIITWIPYLIMVLNIKILSLPLYLFAGIPL